MNKRIIYTGKWLVLGEVDAMTSEGNKHTWEFVTRAGSTKGAVCIIAIKRGASNSIILVKQFRPPIQAEILEFPAGLVETNQTQEDAALRELREETGYIGKIISHGPPIFNTPGLTDEHVSSITIEVSEQLEQQTDLHEEIEVIELPLSNLKEELLKLEATGLQIDAKLWSFAEGLAFR